MTILTAGSVAFDTVQTGEKTVKNALGGSAVYASVASSFISETAVIAAAGNDFPEAYGGMLKNRNIDISGLQIIKGKTFRWSGKYSCDFNRARTLATKLNVFENFAPVLSEKHKNSKYVLLANIDPDIQLKILQKIKKPELVALDTMNLWIKTKMPKLRRILKATDIFFINEDEAKQFSGKKNIIAAAKAICKTGPKILIVKRGEFGAMLFNRNELFFVPSYPVEKVKDTTGAGDVFAGAFFSYVAENKNIDFTTLKKAMFYATVMASFNIESFSVNKLLNLKKRDFYSRLKNLRKMTEL